MSERQVVLTEAGVRKIEEELQQLQTVRRAEVAENIRAAKDLGDVAENPEYETAKTEQAFLEGRISELKRILSSCTVIDEAEVSTDTAGIGTVVTVRDLDIDDEWEFTLVGSYEADPEQDRISNESPIGEAIFGKKVGDQIEADIPAGKIRLEIVSIKREGE